MGYPFFSFLKFNLAFLLQLVIFINCSYAQKNTNVIAPEFMLGKIVSNYKKFPDSRTRKTIQLNIGSFHCDSTRHSNQYFNFPQTGFSIGFSDLGNKENLGEEISVVPYILLNASKKLRHSINFKLGLGASYFTKIYDEETNRFNQAIGSHVNWTFQLFMYYTFYASDHINLRLGGGYWHSSNSHIQLPNYGINSGMLSLSVQYYTRKINFDLRKTIKDKPSTQKFIQIRNGFGIHSLGSTIGPAIGSKKPVYTFDFDYGFLFNQQLKVYAGLFYRYYDSFHDYMKQSDDYENQHLVWQASNINFHIGVEYLLGHVGMNCEGGLNLFKPFYNDFYDLFENGNTFNEFRMSMFNTRLGLNLYLKNTDRNPDSNIALGAHINANFGKADFGEISLTYMKRLK